MQFSFKQFFLYLALSMCLLAGLSSCNDRQANTDGVKIRTPEDLNKPEMIIGGETGTISLYIAKDKLPRAQYLEYFDLTDLCEALVRGKIDAVVYDKPPMEYATRKREGLIILPETLGTGNICVATQLDNHALINQVNSFIDQYRTDGTYDDMYHRWVNTENPQMPNIEVPENPDGKLVVGSSTENEPMGFVGEGGMATGFDIEFAR